MIFWITMSVLNGIGWGLLASMIHPWFGVMVGALAFMATLMMAVLCYSAGRSSHDY